MADSSFSFDDLGSVGLDPSFGLDPSIVSAPVGETFNSGGVLSGDLTGLSDPAGLGPLTGSDVPLGDPNSPFTVDDLMQLGGTAAGPDANTQLAGNSEGSLLNNLQVVGQDDQNIYFSDGSVVDKATGNIYDINGNFIGNEGLTFDANGDPIEPSKPTSQMADNGGAGSGGSFSKGAASGGGAKGSAAGGAAAIGKVQQSLGSVLGSLLKSISGPGTPKGGAQTTGQFLKPSNASTAAPGQLTFAGVSLTTLIFGGLLLWLAFGSK